MAPSLRRISLAGAILLAVATGLADGDLMSAEISSPRFATIAALQIAYAAYVLAYAVRYLGRRGGRATIAEIVDLYVAFALGFGGVYHVATIATPRGARFGTWAGGLSPSHRSALLQFTLYAVASPLGRFAIRLHPSAWPTLLPAWLQAVVGSTLVAQLPWRLAASIVLPGGT